MKKRNKAFRQLGLKLELLEQRWVPTMPGSIGGALSIGENFNLVPASVVSGSDTTGNNASANGSTSADGRYTVFTSNATNLVPGQSDVAETSDVFLFDNQTKSVTLVSRAAGSPTTAANGQSGFAVISADGRFIVFESAATNLLSGQTENNEGDDIFLYDRESGTTQLVSRADGTTNATANHISGATTLLPGTAAISANGRFVAFVSFASNLVEGQNASSVANVYLFDAQQNTMQIVSRAVDSASTTAAGFSLNPVISADGRYVAFTSEANNLVADQTDHSNWDVFLFDKNLESNTTMLVSGAGGSATETGNGESFSDLELAISEDGRFVAFKSFADNLVAGVTDENHNSDIFLFDRDASGPRTRLVSHAAISTAIAATGGSASSEKPVMSSDGRFVAYQSTATNLVDNDSNNAYDVFLYDRVVQNTVLVSHANGSNASANGVSTNPIISSDSTNDNFVIFNSTATNLVSGQVDLNSLDDVFIYSRIGFTTSLVSGQAGSTTTTANGASSVAAINSDGSAVVLTSLADNLGGTDSNQVRDVFVRATIVPTFPTFSFRADSFTTQENGGTARIRVDRTGDTAITAGIDYRVFATAGTDNATEGLDFVADEGTLIFAPGETTLTFEVTILDDILRESTERVFLELLDPSTGGVLGAISTSQLRIQDNDGLGVIDITPDETGTGDSQPMRIVSSADGRFVAFQSNSTNLVPGFVDGNGDALALRDFYDYGDVFVRDRLTGTTTLVSSNFARTASGNGGSFILDISDSGQFIYFTSEATNLVSGITDVNGRARDYFVYDQLTQTKKLISASAGGNTTGNAILNNIFDNDNQDGFYGKMSRDGRYYFYRSTAGDLIDSGLPGKDTLDLYRFDLLEHVTELVSQDPFGNPINAGEGFSDYAISDDGNMVVFESFTKAYEVVGSTVADPSRPPRNGNESTDSYDQMDVFLRNMQTGQTQIVSLNHDRTSVISQSVKTFEISPDGNYIAFYTRADDVTADSASFGVEAMYLLNVAEGTTTVIRGDADLTHFSAGGIIAPQFSGDSRYLFFESDLPDMISGITDANRSFDIYRYDIQHDSLVLVSINSRGDATPGSDAAPENIERLSSVNPTVSRDGRYVAFESVATDLVAGVTDAARSDTGSYEKDVFVRDLQNQTTTILSAHEMVTGNGPSGEPRISSNGQFVFFFSEATDLVPGITDLNVFDFLGSPGNNLFVSPGEFIPGTFQFSDAEVDVSEDGTEAIVTVNRTGGSNGTFVLTVATRASSGNNIATPNVDYLTQNRTVTFEDGQTSATIRIPIIDDDLDEQNETFEVRLTDSSGLSLGTTTTSIVTIVDNDTNVVGNKITEEDGDVVTITLKGAGTLKLSLVDPDGNGKGPIQVDLAGTSASSSILTFKVTKGPNGDGFANVAQITGNGGLKSLAGKQVKLTDHGLDLDGTVLNLTLNDLVNGADISLGGQTSDFIKMTLHNTTAGTTIEVQSGIKTLTANRIFDSQITAVTGIDTITAGRIIGTSIYASFTPTTPDAPIAGGTFKAAVAIKKVTVKGISGEGTAFADSVLAAAKIGTVSLASYDFTIFPGIFEDYGIVANVSIDKVTSKAPKLTYNPTGPADQSSGRFHIKRV